MAPATDDEVLKKFYAQVRPWGFWKPIREKLETEDPSFKPNSNFKRDMINVGLGTIGQTAIVALPIYIVLQNYMGIGISAAIVLVVGIFMKRLWWNKLE